MKKKFAITGMTCSACSSHVYKDVSNLKGVKEVNVNLLSNSMIVDYDDTMVSKEEIIKAVEEGGYNAKEFEIDNRLFEKNSNYEKKRVIYSSITLSLLLYISMGSMIGLKIPTFLDGINNSFVFAISQMILTIIIIVLNFKYFKIGFSKLVKLKPNMDSLIAIGSTSSFIYGVFATIMIGIGIKEENLDLVYSYHMDLYFESAATILTLVTIGKYLEGKSKAKTTTAISKLIDLTPKMALKMVHNIPTMVDTSSINVDDIVMIKPGMSIPVDGIVIEGTSSVDEAMLTGESIPISKEIGDIVSAGTINLNGTFLFKATNIGLDTTVNKIIELIEEASNSKAPIARLADKISLIFVPIVIVISILALVLWLIIGYGFEFAFARSISVLVISCPCALGLATPVAIMVGTGKGVENGILIKSSESIEVAHKVETVVFDKTGTITKGNPVVTNIYTFDNDEHRLLQIAYSLENKSEHPLAKAIIDKAVENNISLVDVREFTSIAGRGIKGVIDDENYLSGNQKLMDENNVEYNQAIKIIEDITYNGKTPLFFSKMNKLIGIIAVRDEIKPSSKEAISSLKKLGIKTIMLTGDNYNTANAIAKEVGIDETIADVIPSQKEEVIIREQKENTIVAMVGDGINDSVALVRADVGIAIGAGADIAIESADIVLIKNDLMDVITTIKLSKKIINNIKMNLFWAFFYNALFIPVAFGAFYWINGLKLTPMIAAIAMSLSSLCVVLNALRLNFFKN